MASAIIVLAVLGPLLLFLVGLAPRAWAIRRPKSMAVLSAGAAWLSLAAALGVMAGVATGPGATQAALAGLHLYVDALSATMLLLVSFLGAVVIRYSRNYLDGDPQQGRFFQWLSLTVAAVMLLVIAGDLLIFVLAWMATSLSLHRLLTFYPERPAALLAARKKFLISRLGDLSLIAAMVLIWRQFGSLDFATLFAAAREIGAGGGAEPALRPWIGFLLVAGALLKSAQFPFHSWLPEVMETPTPVSALLHAGIVSAGGFLVVRLSPLLALAPASLQVLALLGAATALFGSVAMLTQTHVKRALAYSTVGQMGFMMLQCGLGAYSSAILHLVAHALYKAHAFLSSGSIVDIARAAWAPATHSRPHPWRFAAVLALAVALTVGTGLAFGVTPAGKPGMLVLGATLLMALAYLLWNAFEGRITLRLALAGLLLGAAVAVAYFSLQAGFAHWLGGALPAHEASRGAFDLVLMLAVLAAFAALLVLQARFPGHRSGRLWQAAYVHIHNGFYVATLANRLTRRLWPGRTRTPQSH